MPEATEAMSPAAMPPAAMPDDSAPTGAPAARLSRLADTAIAFDPAAVAPPPPAARLSTPAQLMWWRFRRHKVAVASAVLLAAMYLAALFAPFFAPHDADRVSARHASAPPQSVHWFVRDEAGWRFEPHVLGFASRIDPATRARIVTVDPAVRHRLALFVQGEPYSLFGATLHTRLVGTVERDAPFFVLGADRLGRDLLSRIIEGARVSLTIGLIGVAISLVLGVFLGGISGYFGGWVDNLIQRLIELLQSLPTIPLWMGLAAAIPVGMPPLQVYFLITLILSVLGWTSLAREVRGRFMALKSEDFVTAARLDGASHLRTIGRHMVPSMASHIIATVTLAIPGMILAETALSFLGIGLRPPVVSWGVLLQDAQNVQTLAGAPWLLWPGAAVVVAVLAFNFLGDGLRDAADPYAH
jgi:peptide/nickel transport system permease protein